MMNHLLTAWLIKAESAIQSFSRIFDVITVQTYPQLLCMKSLWKYSLVFLKTKTMKITLGTKDILNMFKVNVYVINQQFNHFKYWKKLKL